MRLSLNELEKLDFTYKVPSSDTAVDFVVPKMGIVDWNRLLAGKNDIHRFNNSTMISREKIFLFKNWKYLREEQLKVILNFFSENKLKLYIIKAFELIEVTSTEMLSEHHFLPPSSYEIDECLAKNNIDENKIKKLGYFECNRYKELFEEGNFLSVTSKENILSMRDIDQLSLFKFHFVLEELKTYESFEVSFSDVKKVTDDCLGFFYEILKTCKARIKSINFHSGLSTEDQETLRALIWDVYNNDLLPDVEKVHTGCLSSMAEFLKLSEKHPSLKKIHFESDVGKIDLGELFNQHKLTELGLFNIASVDLGIKPSSDLKSLYFCKTMPNNSINETIGWLLLNNQNLEQVDLQSVDSWEREMSLPTLRMLREGNFNLEWPLAVVLGMLRESQQLRNLQLTVKNQRIQVNDAMLWPELEYFCLQANSGNNNATDKIDTNQITRLLANSRKLKILNFKNIYISAAAIQDELVLPELVHLTFDDVTIEANALYALLKSTPNLLSLRLKEVRILSTFDTQPTLSLPKLEEILVEACIHYYENVNNLAFSHLNFLFSSASNLAFVKMEGWVLTYLRDDVSDAQYYPSIKKLELDLGDYGQIEKLLMMVPNLVELEINLADQNQALTIADGKSEINLKHVTRVTITADNNQEDCTEQLCRYLGYFPNLQQLSLTDKGYGVLRLGDELLELICNLRQLNELHLQDFELTSKDTSKLLSIPLKSLILKCRFDYEGFDENDLRAIDQRSHLLQLENLELPTEPANTGEVVSWEKRDRRYDVFWQKVLSYTQNLKSLNAADITGLTQDLPSLQSITFNNGAYCQELVAMLYHLPALKKFEAILLDEEKFDKNESLDRVTPKLQSLILQDVDHSGLNWILPFCSALESCSITLNLATEELERIEVIKNNIIVFLQKATQLKQFILGSNSTRPSIEVIEGVLEYVKNANLKVKIIVTGNFVLSEPPVPDTPVDETNKVKTNNPFDRPIDTDTEFPKQKKHILQVYFYKKPKLNSNNTEDLPSANNYRLRVDSSEPETFTAIGLIPASTAIGKIEALYKEKYEYVAGKYCSVPLYFTLQRGQKVSLPGLAAYDELKVDEIETNVPLVLIKSSYDLYYIQRANASFEKEVRIQFLLTSKQAVFPQLTDSQKSFIDNNVPKIIKLLKTLKFQPAPNQKPPVSVTPTQEFSILRSIKEPRLVFTAVKWLFEQSKPGKLHLPQSSNPVHPMVQEVLKYQAFLTQGVGSCRHVVRPGMVILRDYGLNKNFRVRMIHSNSHDWLEVYYASYWTPLNLGGYSVVVKEFYSEKKDAIKTQQLSNVSNVNNDLEAIKNNRFLSHYDHRLEQATTFESFWQYLLENIKKLAKGQQNILISFPDQKSLQHFHWHLMYFQKKQQKVYYYLPKPKYVLMHEMRIVQGEAELVESTFIEAIKVLGDEGILAVNMTRDFPSSMNTFIDEDRHIDFLDNTQQGEIPKNKRVVIPKDAIVIGYLDKSDPSSQNLGRDLRGRFHIKANYHVPCESLPFIKEISSPNNNIYEINFYRGIHWQRIIEGNKNIYGHQFSYTRDKFLKAIDEGYRELVFLNCPWGDEEFQQVYADITVHSRVRANGIYEKLPKLHIHTPPPTPYPLTGDYQVEYLIPGQTEIWHSVLNGHYYDYFFFDYTISEKDKGVYTNDGWLAQHKQKFPQQVFRVLVTKNFSEAAFAKLIDQTASFSIKLHFLIAPGITIPQVMLHNASNAAQENVEQLSKKTKKPKFKFIVIESNETYLAQEQLIKEENLTAAIDQKQCLLIALHPKIDSGLLFKEHHVKNGNWYDFYHIETDILKALKTGKTVIITGPLSKNQQEQLELLSANPLIINDEEIELTGKLYIITKEKEAFSFAANREKSYFERNDFWRVLSESYDIELVSKLETICRNLQLNLSYLALKNILKRCVNNYGDWYKAIKPALVMQKDYKQLLIKLRKEIPKVVSVSSLTKIEEPIKQRLNKIVMKLKISNSLFLVGDTGIGKSTLILDYLKEHYCSLGKELVLFAGVRSIKQWALAPKQEHTVYLLYFDEINLLDPATFESFRNFPFVYVDDEYIKVSEDHKIGGTGNFKFDANNARTLIPFFEDEGNYIEIEDIPISYKKEIAYSLLIDLLPKHQPKDCKLLVSHIMDLYTSHPGLTLRDLKRICFRLAVLFNERFNFCLKAIPNEKGSYVAEAMVAFAYYEEVKHRWNKEEKQQFKKHNLGNMNKRYKELFFNSVSFTSVKFFNTAVQDKILKILADHLAIRRCFLEYKETHPDSKDSIINHALFEGESGLLKTSFTIEYLESLNYVNDDFADESVPDERRYVHITPKNIDDFAKKIIAAFHRGLIVAIDELNSLILEGLMNMLMSGYDLEFKKAAKPGFIVIGNQNPISYKNNRVAQSIPEMNRYSGVKLREYKDQEYLDILTKFFKCPLSKAQERLSELHQARELAAKYKLDKPTPKDLFHDIHTIKV